MLNFKSLNLILVCRRLSISLKNRNKCEWSAQTAKVNEENHTKRLSMCKKLQNVKTFEKVVEKKKKCQKYIIMRFGEWILLLHVQVTNAIHDVRVNLPFKAQHQFDPIKHCSLLERYF